MLSVKKEIIFDKKITTFKFESLLYSNYNKTYLKNLCCVKILRYYTFFYKLMKSFFLIFFKTLTLEFDILNKNT